LVADGGPRRLEPAVGKAGGQRINGRRAVHGEMLPAFAEWDSELSAGVAET
jgi:hypothetical protein